MQFILRLYLLPCCLLLAMISRDGMSRGSLQSSRCGHYGGWIVQVQWCQRGIAISFVLFGASLYRHNVTNNVTFFSWSNVECTHPVLAYIVTCRIAMSPSYGYFPETFLICVFDATVQCPGAVSAVINVSAIPVNPIIKKTVSSTRKTSTINVAEGSPRKIYLLYRKRKKKKVCRIMRKQKPKTLNPNKLCKSNSNYTTGIKYTMPLEL